MPPPAPIRVARLERDPSGPRSMRPHTEHALAYVADGRVPLEGGRVEAPAGAVVVLPAGVPGPTLGAAEAVLWVVRFCSTCLRLDEDLVLMSPFRRVRHGATPVVPIAEWRRARVVQRFHDLHEESERGAPESLELARSLVLLLLGEVRRATPGPLPPADGGGLVSEALTYIQQHCFTPISLRHVAAAVHRTPAHVAAVVKKATGHSVGQWIRAGRVAEAAARLAHTDDPIGEVAAHVGWQDKTHFIRMFRRAYGVTPAAWRREHHALHGQRAGGDPAGGTWAGTTESSVSDRDPRIVPRPSGGPPEPEG